MLIIKRIIVMSEKKQYPVYLSKPVSNNVKNGIKSNPKNYLEQTKQKILELHQKQEVHSVNPMIHHHEGHQGYHGNKRTHERKK